MKHSMVAQRAAKMLPPILLAVLVVGLWQSGVFHRIFSLQEFTVAYPDAIARAIGAEAEDLVRHMGYTFLEAAIGFAAGSSLGFIAAFILSEIPWARRGILPVISGLAAMPIIALAPLMALYFGLGIMSKVAVIVIMTFPPMAVTTFKGLTSVDPDLEDLMVSYAAGTKDVLFRLRLVWALPYIFTGLKLNVTLSLIGAIIAEFFAARSGLGFRMSYALDTFDMPVAWATMGLAALLGVAWYQLVAYVERRSIPWHVSMRGQAD